MMKSISQVIDQTNLRPNEENASSPSGRERAIAARFWAEMDRLLNARWSSTHDDVPSDEWVQKINKLTIEELDRGLKAIESPKWAESRQMKSLMPAWSEFLAIAKKPKRENAAAYRIPKSHQLPKKLSETERLNGSRHCANMKKILGRGGQQSTTPKNSKNPQDNSANNAMSRTTGES